MLTALPEVDPDSLAIFLDLDGTLVDIAQQPHLVEIPESLLAALDAAHTRLTGALAIISGRTIASLDELLAPLRLPTAGVHGLEYRDGGGRIHHMLNVEIPAECRQSMKALVESNKGLLLEDKGSCLTLHYRQNPAKEALVKNKMAAMMDRIGPGFTLQNGKMIVELRPTGINKGTAIETFMAIAPFIGRKPVFIGDDTTDEDGFAVINNIGGYSVRVSPNPTQTEAKYAMPDVSTVREWLDSISK
jgi:trehalose 6-phosphate phosphatase